MIYMRNNIEKAITPLFETDLSLYCATLSLSISCNKDALIETIALKIKKIKRQITISEKGKKKLKSMVGAKIM